MLLLMLSTLVDNVSTIDSVNVKVVVMLRSLVTIILNSVVDVT